MNEPGLDTRIAELTAAAERDDGHDVPALQGELGVALLDRFLDADDEADFRTGTQCLNAALNAAPGHAETEYWLWTLAGAHRWRAVLHGDPADLDAALAYLALLRRLHDASPGDELAEIDVARGQVLLHRHELTSAEDDLERAVEILLPVVSAERIASAVSADAAHMLCAAYRYQAMASGDPEQAQRAVSEAALALARFDPPAGLPDLVLEHALALRLRWRFSAQPAHLEEAIAGWQRLVTWGSDGQPPPIPVAEAVAVHAELLRDRFAVLSSEAPHGSQTAAALEDAVAALRTAQQMLPDDSPIRLDIGWMLALCSFDRYDAVKDPSDLDRGIAELGGLLRALDGRPDGEIPAGPLSTMARALHERAALGFAAGGGSERVRADLSGALTHIRRAIAVVNQDDPDRPGMLWLAIFIGYAAGATAPELADPAELSRWTGQIADVLAATDPGGPEAEMASCLNGLALAAHAERDGSIRTPEVTQRIRDAMRVIIRESATPPAEQDMADLAADPRMAMLLNLEQMLGPLSPGAVEPSGPAGS